MIIPHQRTKNLLDTVSQLDPVHPSSSSPNIWPHALASGRNMLPAIPQELSHMILDFLHDDVAALCSADLVCKSWFSASRFHLFSNIELRVVDYVPRRLEVICAECSTSLSLLISCLWRQWVMVNLWMKCYTGSHYWVSSKVSRSGKSVWQIWH